MQEVEVYRLWPDHTWDTTRVLVESEPWNNEIVESRACAAAWLEIAKNELQRPLRVGLFTLIQENERFPSPMKLL